MKISKVKVIIFAIVILVSIFVGIFIVNKNGDSKFQKQLDLGNEALLNMNYEDAIVAFDNAIKLNPKSVPAYLGIAEAYVGLGDYEKACEYLEKGYEETGDNSILDMLESLKIDKFVSIGKEYLAEGDPNSAKDAFDEVLNIDPSNEDAKKGVEDSINHPDYVYGEESDLDNIEDNVESDNANSSVEDIINGDEQENSGLAFKPSDITWFGYPVIENHYEEWKSALNFSGDDTDKGGCVDKATEYGDMLICGNGTYTDQGTPLKINLDDNGAIFLGWDNVLNASNMSTYTFYLNASDKWNHIGQQYVSGPFYIGQTFEDALQIAGYTGEIVYNNEAVSISDNITVRGFSHGDINGVMFTFDQTTHVSFSGTGNVVTQIVVQKVIF